MEREVRKLMANFFYLTLDTTAPANPSIIIEGGATYATAQLVNCAISTSDGTTTGYQMKIWGNVDTAYDSDVQDTEGGSAWITYQTSKQIKLSETDGSKTIYLKIRDDVHNVSSQASDSIILNTSIPTVIITGPDVAKISKVSGKDTSAFSFSSTEGDDNYVEYKVKVVATTGAAHTTGTQIPTTAGSTNMSGDGGNWTHSSVIECTIKGADLETASAGDGEKIIKVFIKDIAGNWST
jgi:hypothetical protein